MKRCNHCGALIEDHARFCTSCGNSFEQQFYRVTHHTNWWLYIVGALFILLVGFLCFYYFMKGNENVVASSQISDISSVSKINDKDDMSIDKTITDEVDTKENEGDIVEEKVIPLEHQMHYFVFCRNGLWGLRNDMKDITEAIYTKAVEMDGYVMFIRQDGLYDFYQFSNKIFSKPADDYEIGHEGQFEYLIAHHGKEIMIFTPYRTHVLENVKAFKKIDDMLLCRFENDDFMFLGVTGLEYKDGLKHPRRLICRSSDAELVVCEEPNGNQHVFKTDCRGYCEFTPDKWAIVERDYLESTNIEDPVFEKVYEHGPTMTYIYDQLR